MVWEHLQVQELPLRPGLDLKVVVGVGGVLVWLGGRGDEGEAGVWAPCLEMWGHRAGSQQEAPVMVGVVHD